MENNIKKRGFASLTLEHRQTIARQGGLAVSRNSEWMKLIGQKGGIQSGFNRRARRDNKK